MKSNKISRLKISAIFATIAFAICLIVAFALISNSAFASDGESESNEQINATTHQIRFTTQGIDSGVDVSYKLSDSGTLIKDFKLGDRLEVEDGASVGYICTPGATNNRIIVKDSNHNYLFLIDTPLGYDFQKCSTSVETVNEDINFVMSYTSNPNPYTLNLTIQNISGEPLKGAKVKFFSLNTDTAYTGITGDDGEYTFPNLTSTQAIGSVFAEFDGYANSVKFIDAKYYNKNHLYKTSLKLPNIDSASILASTKSAHHKTFEYEVITNNDAVGAHNDLKVQNESLCINDRLSPPCEWVVGMDGSLDYTVTESATTKKTIIRPICEPGYSLVK